MQHNDHLKAEYFTLKSEYFDKNTSIDFLKYCVGAALYMPATRNFADIILQNKLPNVTSIIVDLEDAVDKSQVPFAEANIKSNFEILASALQSGRLEVTKIPLIFIRVRSAIHFEKLADTLNSAIVSVLTGFCFPKFDSVSSDYYFEVLSSLNEKFDSSLYCMPILEGKKIAFIEERKIELIKLRKIMKKNNNLILNVRVGATDISSAFGVRRGVDYSVYDILPVSSALTDIINVFNRPEDNFVISGPVWEYFLSYKQDDFIDLLSKDFNRSFLNRNTIINQAVDGLVRELIIDRANGFIGKTIIHPSHAKIVNFFQTVNEEEFEDATQILSTDGGVAKSPSGNKMNEINPHRNWAIRTISRAKAFGVISKDVKQVTKMLGDG